MTQELASPEESPDVQEALSARYIVGLRLLLLASGRVAVFDRDGLKFILDPYRSGVLLQNDIRGLLEADRDRVEAYRPRGLEPSALQTTVSLGDLDL